MKYAIIGLGFVSARHLDAIVATSGRLWMACDIDKEKEQKVRSFIGCRFFTDYKEMMGHKDFDEVDYVVICTPNHLHLDMIQRARLLGKKVICEKPVVLDPEDIYSLDKNVNVVMQLRHSPLLPAMLAAVKPKCNQAYLKINIHRGEWYFNTWKHDVEKSGGLFVNIGIHYFDIINSLFGGFLRRGGNIYKQSKFVIEGKRAYGMLQNEKMDIVKWEIDITVPMDNQIRCLDINGKFFNLGQKFEGLHTKVYECVLADMGLRPLQTIDSLKLASKLQKIAERGL